MAIVSGAIRNVNGEVDLTGVIRVLDNAFIPFDPANTDCQTLKAQINSGQAELQDAEGNLLSPQEAKAFVATLP